MRRSVYEKVPRGTEDIMSDKVVMVALRSTGEVYERMFFGSWESAVNALRTRGLTKEIYKSEEMYPFAEYTDPSDKSQTATVTVHSVSR